MSDKIIYRVTLRGNADFEKKITIIAKDEEEAAEIAEKAIIKSLEIQNFDDIHINEIYCDGLDESISE